MSFSPAAPRDPIAQRTAQLAREYAAAGELELLFVRQIASAEATFHSLQRAIERLAAAPRLTERAEARLERLTHAQARSQRILTTALKELKALQLHRRAPHSAAPHLPAFTTRLLADPAFLASHARQLLPPIDGPNDASQTAPKPSRARRLTQTAA